MRREEYLFQKECYENPYSVWKWENQLQLTASDLDKIKAEVLSEYELFTIGEVSIEDGFWIRAKEKLDEEPDLIYSDEDVLGKSDPFFKPDKSPETLESFYYIGAATLLSKSLLKEFDCGFDYGSVEYLRECVKKAESFCHISEVTLHCAAKGDYRYRDSTKKTFDGEELISAVILSKDNPGILEKCASSLRAAADAENQRLEIIVVDNGSSEENARIYRENSEKYGFSYMPHPMPFEYSTLCNYGAEAAKGRFLFFLNDDVEVPAGTEFLREMLYYAAKKEVGAVGSKLLYPDGRSIQHNGITMLKSGPSHKLCTYSDENEYYYGVNRSNRNVWAVTGAALMVEASKFKAVGGFDENLKIAYTDMDLCFALIEKGFRNVCLSDFYLIHHESLSRDDDINDRGAFERLEKERKVFENKYERLLEEGDPYYSVNLTRTRLDYSADILTPEERLDPKRESEPLEVFSLKPASKKTMASLDSVSFHLSDANGNRDFYEFDGWAFVSGRAGYEYDAVIVIDSDNDRKIFWAARTLREDVKGVFPKEKDIDLVGFKAKISKDHIAAGKKYSVKIGLVRPQFFNKSKYKGFLIDTDKSVLR